MSEYVEQSFLPSIALLADSSFSCDLCTYTAARPFPQLQMKLQNFSAALQQPFSVCFLRRWGNYSKCFHLCFQKVQGPPNCNLFSLPYALESSPWPQEVGGGFLRVACSKWKAQFNACSSLHGFNEALGVPLLYSSLVAVKHDCSMLCTNTRILLTLRVLLLETSFLRVGRLLKRETWVQV